MHTTTTTQPDTTLDTTLDTTTDSTSRPVRPDAALTARESAVLGLLTYGLTNRQIADQLFLSIDTVKTHVRRICTKLGVHNRTQAALRSFDQALVIEHR